jgi:hypothetical protein
LGGGVLWSRAVTDEMALPASVLMAGTWALTLAYAEAVLALT